MAKICHYLFCFWVLSTSFVAKAENNSNISEPLISLVPQTFKHQTLNNINVGIVNSVMQSRNGYIWLSTNDGLIRYDGYDAKRFAKDDNNSNSLSHNMVMSAVEDQQGNLWISTYGGGLNKFTLATGEFKKIDLRVNGTDPPVTDFLYFLSIDNDQQLWVGTIEQLGLIDLKTEKSIALPQALVDDPPVYPQKVIIDSHNHLWLRTSQSGVYWFDHTRWWHFQENTKPSTGLGRNTVHAITEDENGTIWLATAVGLQRFNPQDHSFTQFLPSDNPGFSRHQDDIFSIQSDHKGSLWFGSIIDGAGRFSIKSEQFSQVSGPADSNQHFPRTMIRNIFRDQQGTLWFATDNGVIQLTQQALKFNYLSNSSATLRVTDVQLTAPDTLSLIGDFKFYDYDLTRQVVKQRFSEIERAYNFVIDANQHLWLASIGQGLFQYNPQNQQLTHYAAVKTSDNFSLDAIFALKLDRQNQLWVAAFPDEPNFSGGLYRFDQQQLRFDTYLTELFITDLWFNPDPTSTLMMLGTQIDGLIELQIDGAISKRQKKPEIVLQILSLLYDFKGDLWMGTDGKGLVHLDPKTQQTRYYNTSDGLLSNSIRSIVEDDQHDLWLGTPVGLTRFTPATGQVLNFEKQDGLLFSAFYKRHGIKKPDGTIVMPTNQGLVYFNPAEFSAEHIAAKVQINDFKLFNQPVRLQRQDPQSPLEKPIEFTDHI